MSKLLQLALIAVVVVCASAQDPASGVRSQDVTASLMTTREPLPDLLEQTAIPEAMKIYWKQVARFLWSYLLTNDYDYFNSLGEVVPPNSTTVAYAASGRDVKCGRFARNWIRLGFHDCGTYSRFLRRYGCNGSVRKELPHTDTWYDYTTVNPDGKTFKLMSHDVFDQFKTNGVLDPAVDVAFNPLHHPNAGLAASIAAIYQAKLYANSPATGLWDASYADVLALASLLALARCDGPQVKFVPGRADSHVADQDDQLPSFGDNFFHTLFYFLGSGLSELDGITLIAGSHSTACFQAGCMDSTPTKVDKAWAQELLQWDGAHPAVCGANQTDRCMAPSDTIWLEHDETKDYLKLLTSPVASFEELDSKVTSLLNKQGVNYYRGLIKGANLCDTTDRVCKGHAENYALHTLMASSMYRLLNLKPTNL